MATLEQAERSGGGAAPPSEFDVVVVGGFGHVGLPLAVSLANSGLQVCALDIRAEVAEQIASGIVPFMEEGCEAALRAALDAGTFHISLDEGVISQTDVVIVVIGTPIDRHLNPEFDPMWAVLDSIAEHLIDGQLVVLRSTVYPGTTERLNRSLFEKGKRVDVAFCPERIAEGHAMTGTSLPAAARFGVFRIGLAAVPRAVRLFDRRHRRTGALGSRARKALFEHLALHVVCRR